MTILTPPAAVDGTANLIITGVGMSGTPQLVATDGTQTFIVELDVNSQSATNIDINLDTGLAATILAPLLANAGVPLTDPQWSLKWRVGADELGVVVSAPSNHQQREVAETEKFGGVLADIPLGEKDQLVAKIITGTNTVRLTESNGKATGSRDGVERIMSETLTDYIWTAGTEKRPDGKWRARDVVITPFSLGLWFDGESWVDSDEWID